MATNQYFDGRLSGASVFLCVFVCLCVSLCVFVCLCVSFCVFAWLCMSLRGFVCVYVCNSEVLQKLCY